MKQTVHCKIVVPNKEACIFFNQDETRTYNFKTRMDGYLTINSFFDHKYIDEDEACYLIGKVSELELPSGEEPFEDTSYNETRFNRFDEPFTEN